MTTMVKTGKWIAKHRILIVLIGILISVIFCKSKQKMTKIHFLIMKLL